MAGKSKRMSQIKQLIRLHRQGLGMSRNMVKSYLQKIETGELAIEPLLSLYEPVLEGKLFAGPPLYKQERYGSFKHGLDYFSKELQRVVYHAGCFGTNIGKATTFTDPSQGRFRIAPGNWLNQGFQSP